MVSTTRFLTFANPFSDHCALVNDEFLQQHGLKKGDTTIASKKSEIDSTWKEAKKSGRYTKAVGGSGTSVTKVLAHLGNSCSLYGMTGTDTKAEKVQKALTQIGIKPLFVTGSQPIGIVNCFVTSGGERTMQCLLGVGLEFSAQAVSDAHFQDVDHVHLEGYLFYYGDAVEKILTLAKKNHVTVSMDLASQAVVNTFKSRLEKCINLIDIVFGNEQEIQDLKNISDTKQAVESFGSHQLVFATLGERGCIVKNSYETVGVHYDALPTPNVLDSTGAGDFFTGAALDAIFRGKSIPDCVKRANISASSVIQQLGAELPEQEWANLNQRIETI